jgi:hypothetical protein
MAVLIKVKKENLKKLKSRGKLSDLAGCWNMTDKEADYILNGSKKAWKKWTKKYF